MNAPKFCKKRNGSIEPFDKKFIIDAINKAFHESKEGNRYLAGKVTESVVESIIRSFPEGIPSVEEIQEIVIDALMEYRFKKATKAYINYRNERNRTRVHV